MDEEGRVRAQTSAAYSVSAPEPGAAEADPEEWWQAAIEAVSSLPERLRRSLTCIGLSRQMHGVVPCDEQGLPLRPALLWADSRSRDVLGGYRPLVGSDLPRLGNPVTPGMAGPMLLWLHRRQPQLSARLHAAPQPKDWLRWRLTGVLCSEPSDASGTLLWDVVDGGWIEGLVGRLGLERIALPPAVPSWQEAGRLTDWAASQLDVPKDLPLAAGAADTAAAAFGSGLLEEGEVQLTVGSGAQVIVPCTQAVPITGSPPLQKRWPRVVPARGNSERWSGAGVGPEEAGAGLARVLCGGFRGARRKRRDYFPSLPHRREDSTSRFEHQECLAGSGSAPRARALGTGGLRRRRVRRARRLRSVEAVGLIGEQAPPRGRRNPRSPLATIAVRFTGISVRRRRHSLRLGSGSGHACWARHGRLPLARRGCLTSAAATCGGRTEGQLRAGGCVREVQGQLPKAPNRDALGRRSGQRGDGSVRSDEVEGTRFSGWKRRTKERSFAPPHPTPSRSRSPASGCTWRGARIS
jgi:hypothetical protein